jgi:hypothetical protein
MKEENESGWKPLGIRGTWWHETLRALGTIEGLPLVITRLGYLYGPNTISTEGMFVSSTPAKQSRIAHVRNDHLYSHSGTCDDIRRVFVQADRRGHEVPLEFQAPEAHDTRRRCCRCYLGVCRVSWYTSSLICPPTPVVFLLHPPNPRDFLARLSTRSYSGSMYMSLRIKALTIISPSQVDRKGRQGGSPCERRSLAPSLGQQGRQGRTGGDTKRTRCRQSHYLQRGKYIFPQPCSSRWRVTKSGERIGLAMIYYRMVP